MNHEGHNGHEGRPAGMRLQTPLSAEAEQAMTVTIGSAIAVHRALGPGFLESVYKKAMQIELTRRGVGFETEKPIVVRYAGVAIPGQRVDLVVAGLIVVELKAIRTMDDIHYAQVISYLRTMGLRGGLLINFKVPLLRHGIKRIIV